MGDYIQMAAAIAGIISTILGILEFIKVKKRNRKLEQEIRNIASTGVALGYYHNFVVDVFTKLKETKLKIIIYKDNSTEVETIKEYDSDDVRLQVIMPDNLSIEAMNQALATMRLHRKGDIVSKGATRNFGINFRFDGDHGIVILDFPKPLDAVRKHLLLDPQFISSIQKDGRLSGEGVLESDAWKKAEQEELANFKSTIFELMKRGRLDEGQSKIEFIGIHDVPPEK